ncbi:MAG TPA: phosphoenolpyruvate--protein phosphotransferase [Longimicrobiaceae bacterium]|nr:phosphoenolpyruvate--protein phosphotransferase [Longimicrobiaceae bacterium]
MDRVRDGISASPGIVIGPARVLHMDAPPVPHGGIIPQEQVEAEVERFYEACNWAKEEIRQLREHTRVELGEVEAQIFDPQLLMLEDVDLVGSTAEYIRKNFLTAERAFEWRVLEWETRWSHTTHPMVLDKLNDLADVQARVLRRLLGVTEPDLALHEQGEGIILVARDLTPSLAAQLDSSRVIGLATDSGTRTSHSSILARSQKVPSVVSLGSLSEEVRTGDELILDGRAGRVIIHPTEEEKEAYRVRDFQTREWEQELLLLARLDAVTLDGARIALRANIDLPGEAGAARAHGAEGIGLFRTEFLVVGRNAVPGEDEQYAAYRKVLEAFPEEPVVIRTYDLGGDKFPAFLHMPKEENPFLGWRAIRVCLDEPRLFRAQLRALLRAGQHGDLRIMLPLVNDIAEVEATRRMIDECVKELEAEGHGTIGGYSLGAMIETPAAAITAPELSRHVDFFSVGTNDLVQYTLAVDRGNSRLAKLYNSFHPAVVRLLKVIADAGDDAGLEVSVCGELAAHPLGAFLLIGLGVDSLSVGPSALAEIKKVIRSVSQARAKEAAAESLTASTPDEVESILAEHMGDDLDLSLFTGSWNVSRRD